MADLDFYPCSLPFTPLLRGDRRQGILPPILLLAFLAILHLDTVIDTSWWHIFDFAVIKATVPLVAILEKPGIVLANTTNSLHHTSLFPTQDKAASAVAVFKECCTSTASH